MTEALNTYILCPSRISPTPETILAKGKQASLAWQATQVRDENSKILKEIEETVANEHPVSIILNTGGYIILKTSERGIGAIKALTNVDIESNKTISQILAFFKTAAPN